MPDILNSNANIQIENEQILQETGPAGNIQAPQPTPVQEAPQQSVAPAQQTSQTIAPTQQRSSELVQQRKEQKPVFQSDRAALPSIVVDRVLGNMPAPSVPQPQRGQQMMAAQPAAGSGYENSDVTLPEEDRNPNNADTDFRMAPLANLIEPVSIAAPEGQTPRITMEETTKLVQDYVSGDDSNLVERNKKEPKVKTARSIETKSISKDTFSSVQKERKDSTKNTVASKLWNGNAFSEKAIASRDVDPQDVGIGYMVLSEIVREPGNELISIVNEATGMDFTIEQLITDAGLSAFANAINAANIYVVAVKSPVPNPASTQTRRLKITEQARGVYVHPTQIKTYNMDFDGDEVKVQFTNDPSLFRSGMDLLITELNDPAIDLSFFPLPRINATRAEFINGFKDVFCQSIPDGVGLSEMAGALYDLMYRDEYLIAHPKESEADLIRAFIRSMDSVAKNFSNRDDVLSYLLKDVFDKMERINSIYALTHYEESPDVSIGQMSPVDEYVTMVIDDVKKGNLPPNFQDFLIALHRYSGEIPGKNVMFRLGADVAKRHKFSSQIFKGEEGARELYDLTLEAGMAAWMNGRAHIGDKIAYIQNGWKTAVISEVGFPTDYKNIGEWIRAFAAAYNRYKLMVDMADIKFRCDLDPYPDKPEKLIDLNSDVRDLAKPLAMIYGDYTVERLFPDLEYDQDANEEGRHYKYYKDERRYKLLARYKNYTLSKLKKDNRISTTRLGKQGKIKINQATSFDIVLAIADMRSSSAAKFGGESGVLASVLEDMVIALNGARGSKSFLGFGRRWRSHDQSVDFKTYIKDLVALLHMTGPDMFEYYGMTDPYSFMNSFYGKHLQKAANRIKGNKVDYVGGVRMAMIVQYRLHRIQDMNAQIAELLKESNRNALYTIPRINELQNKIQEELETLASSSDLWAVIVAELRAPKGQTTYFQRLKESKGEDPSLVWSDSRELWKGRRLQKYNSFIELLVDPELERSIKQKVSVDMVRMATGFTSLKAFEIDYQLEIGPHAAHTSISPMAYREQPSIISDLEEAHNRMQRYFDQSWSSVRDEVRKAREESEPGQLDAYVKHLAENPQAYMEITDDMIAYAIDEQMSKTSRSSEKAHQEIPVDALYNAISEQRGGLNNSMYRSDSRILGMISESNLSALDIIRVLADPSLSYTVYNGKYRYELSRKTLCGSNSETDLWRMLEKNPRIAALLRPGVATVSQKDKVYKTATAGFYDGFKQYDKTGKAVLKGKVRAALVDRPMFLAMVGMLRPQSGKHARGVHADTKQVLNALESLIIGLAKRQVELKNGTLDLNKYIEEKLGITVESLQTIGGMDAIAAENWYGEITKHFALYVSEVAKIIKDGGYQEIAQAVYDSSKSAAFEFDASSVLLAVDVHQTMTGAKTQTSTSVEGGMTQENLGVSLWAMSMNDNYTVISSDMSQEELAPFIGMQTNVGVFTGDNILELEEALGDSEDPIVVQIPQADQDGKPLGKRDLDALRRKDDTLDDEGRQIPSVGKWLISKRTRASEDLNLKHKKAGDDGKDSISKTSKYNESSNSNVFYLQNVYETEGLFAATLELARLIQASDIDEGFDDLDLGHYMNIASYMIKEITDETGKPGIVIRSLGECSLAIRSQMPQTIVDAGTPGEIIRAAREIAENVATDELLQTSEATDLAQIAASTISMYADTGSFKPAKNASMSSSERSFNLLDQIVKQRQDKNKKALELGQGVRPEAKVYPKKLREERELWLKKNGYIPNMNYGGYTVTNVIGRNTAEAKKGPNANVRYSIGQTSVWLIDITATDDQIIGALREAYDLGITVAFKNPAYLRSHRDAFIDDIIEAPFGSFYMLPFFDMRLNGSSLSGPAAPPSFQYDPSWVWYIVEDSQNLYALSDGEALISGKTVEQTQTRAGDVESISFDDLFFHTFQAYPDRDVNIRFASREEIEEDIVYWKDDGPTIDYGITDDNSYYSEITKKLGLQIEEYRQNFVSTDENGFLTESRPDRIIGWLICEIDGVTKPVYAPIIMWPTGTTGPAPTRFSIRDYDQNTSGRRINTSTWALDVSWQLIEDLDGQYCKVHDGSGAAAKSMVLLDKLRDLGNFLHGRNIDMVVASESFASRRLAWGKRMGTLKTLAQTMAMPPYGYNYAEHPSSFPGDPKDRNGVSIKERLKTERIPLEEWPDLIGLIEHFSSDPIVDALLRQQIELAISTKTINPSDLLATKFGDQYAFMYIDYDFMFGTEINFQNALMRWYNMMQSDVCPPSIEDYYDRSDGQGYLFKPITQSNNPYEVGTLQMYIPHVDPTTGRTFYHWENVYASFSFFNDDYSGMHKVGLNGANRTMEQLTAMAASGMPLSGKDMRMFVKNTASLSFRPANPYNIESDYGRFLQRER